MAYREMYNEVMGYVPGLNVALARTKVREALALIEDEQLWSFQLAEAGWYPVGLLGGNGGFLSPGTITVAPYSTTITGDANASAAWLGLVGRPFLTERQIRSPFYSLYNIVGVDSTIPTAVVLTIDRPWMEPPQTNAGYMIYQAYFAVRAGFKKFFAARDTTNNSDMNYWKLTQLDLSVVDPERTNFDEPAYIVPYQVDNRPNTSTPGQMLYELWPHPLAPLPYSYSYLWQGPSLSAPTDTVPYPLTEELVKHRAFELLCLWKEAQKGDSMARGSGANWQFLAKEAHEQYEMRLKTAKLLDQNLVDLYWTKFRRDPYAGDPFATVTGQLNVGGW
jgi:hypothetical protein